MPWQAFIQLTFDLNLELFMKALGIFFQPFLSYKLKHVCLSITFIEEATQKWPVKSTACTSNKNKIFHRKAFCAALRLLSHLFNLYGHITPWVFGRRQKQRFILAMSSFPQKMRTKQA